MPIAFGCPCGRRFEVGEHLVGVKTSCPSCGSSVIVPAESSVPPERPPPVTPEPPASELVEELVALSASPAPPAVGGRWGKTQTEAAAPREVPVVATPVSSWEEARQRVIQESEAKDAARELARESRRQSSGVKFGPAAWQGAGMMAFAAVWFFTALAAGWIFFYPPILFVIGTARLFSGMMSNDDELDA